RERRNPDRARARDRADPPERSSRARPIEARGRRLQSGLRQPARRARRGRDREIGRMPRGAHVRRVHGVRRISVHWDQHVSRDYQLAQEGLYSEADWKQKGDLYAHWCLGNRCGRAWWDQKGKTLFPEEFAAYLSKQLNEAPGSDSHAQWLAIRARVTGAQTQDRPGICKSRAIAPVPSVPALEMNSQRDPILDHSRRGGR